MLRDGNHHSKKMQRHFNKYGMADLVFSVLHFCDRTELLKREQLYLDELKPYFNSSPTAGSQLGFKQSEDAKRKNGLRKKGNKYWVGKKHKEESKAKMRAAKLGRKLSPETRAKLSKARIGNRNTVGTKNRLGKSFTADAKRRISESLKKYFSDKRRAGGNLDLFR